MRQDSHRARPAVASFASCRHPVLRWRVLPRRPVMADLAYVLLVIGGFAVLVLTMRGLQRL
jgi:hypothetical protein